MSQFDKIFGNLATQLIDKTFGTAAVVLRETSTYDVESGDNNMTSVSHPVSISPPAPIKKSRLKDGTVFQMGDLTCMVARQGIPIVPNPTSDRLVYQGSNYQIIEVNPLVSGDQDAAYELVCRI